MSEKRVIKDPSDDKIKTVVDKAKDILYTRQQAYQQTFRSEKNVFAKIILDDLARYCRANETTFHPDGRVQAALEGRREVWLRIHNHLTLDPEALTKMYLKRSVEE